MGMLNRGAPPATSPVLRNETSTSASLELRLRDLRYTPPYDGPTPHTGSLTMVFVMVTVPPLVVTCPVPNVSSWGAAAAGSARRPAALNASTGAMRRMSLLHSPGPLPVWVLAAGCGGSVGGCNEYCRAVTVE